MGWLNDDELKKFKQVGRGCKVSRHALIYGAENVSLGDNVRIDAHTIILASSGWLNVGSHVHIAVQNMLLCSGGLNLGDYCAVASGCKILSASDDYASGNYLIGPGFDADLFHVTKDPVTMDPLSALGLSCCVLPGAQIGEGAVVGACSLVPAKMKLLSWWVYMGQPAKPVKTRSAKARDLAKEWDKRWANKMGST